VHTGQPRLLATPRPTTSGVDPTRGEPGAGRAAAGDKQSAATDSLGVGLVAAASAGSVAASARASHMFGAWTAGIGGPRIWTAWPTTDRFYSI
jgi:hypothetical protein